ncbi:MAG: DNA polymerase IV [Clostridia bacterium]|nr:DNA polymerase IV [Clostridia bacterium]
MRERVILHSDLNNFFASVETVLNPELKGKPVIVCGDPRERRGVVFAKNEEAKKYGIRTAETVVSALRKCPQVIRVETHFHEYKRYSRLVREIYERFTDAVEECSIDECSLDMTASVRLFGSGVEIAEKIRRAVREELGLTVSIGVSFNKPFAKLASEFKKPDAVSYIPKEGFEKIVYPLPVTDMLYVGKSTAQTLLKYGIRTIGDLAVADEELLLRLLGKRGRQLLICARGEDEEPVRAKTEKEDLKSIGNSMTLPYDVTSREEIKRWLFVLSESVAARLRDADVGKANTVHIVVKNERLEEITCQKKVPPTTLCKDIALAGCELFCAHYPHGAPVHMIGVTVSGFDYHIEQISLTETAEGGDDYQRRERAETAVANIRKKYGYAMLQRGIVMEDERSKGLDIRGKKQETVSQRQVIERNEQGEQDE